MLERDPRNAQALATLAQATQVLSEDAAPVDRPAPEPAPAGPDFDWAAAESELAGVVEPAFVGEPVEESAERVERVDIRLADVGGMEEVKRRLETAFPSSAPGSTPSSSPTYSTCGWA